MRKLKQKKKQDHEAKVAAANQDPNDSASVAETDFREASLADNEHSIDGRSLSQRSSKGVDKKTEAEDEDEDASRTRWESDYFLAPNPGLFADYLELSTIFPIWTEKFEKLVTF